MYDFKLEWNLDADKSSAAIPATGTDAPVAREPAGPTLFSALQDQLGLRLEALKAPAATTIVDHVARPSVN
jgi:uncharacterized protein (TIGR03435 family)